jgi:DNA-binding NarL/FixJ family response regulator
VHAVGSARSGDALASLREHAVAVDRARGRLRRTDVDEALGLWRGLAAGRWSLVEHFESDGRRYYLARENPPAVAGVLALTQRERCVAALAACGHSNKLIAYELGLSVGTVSTHLKAAMKKLGLARRANLVRLGATLGATHGGASTK